MESSDIVDNGECGVCGLIGPLQEIQDHFLTQHVDHVNENDSREARDENNENQCNNDQIKLWTKEHVLLLIRLVEKNQAMFDTALKKKVWTKIAEEMGKITKKHFTPEQIDNKWKGLKKTYKKVKDHNNKSGNDAKLWEFFYPMDEFLSKRPEITPLAVCSSSSGLILNSGQEYSNENSIPECSYASSPTTSDRASDYESSFMRKRKHVASAAQKRHDEKIARYDQFFKLFKVMVEHQVGKKVDL